MIIMAKKKEDTFIGTHARITLSDWPVLADLVIKHSQLIKEQVHESQDPEETPLPHVISKREIEDAIEGPMQDFFKEKITAYAKISRIQLNLTMLEDEAFKDRRAKLTDEDKVPKNILENTSTFELAKIQHELDELTRTHEEQWQQHREQWNQLILEHLNEQGLALSEIEMKEFVDPEPISELLERYVALNIELPKTRKSEMNFANYLTLKANIAIQSALSRQHMPHASSDIQKALSKLKADFNNIAKAETELLNNQKSATAEIIASISW